MFWFCVAWPARRMRCARLCEAAYHGSPDSGVGSMAAPLRKEIQIAPPPPPPPPTPPETELVYRRDEQPRSTHDWLLYGFQWLVTMVYAVVWGYAIVGVGLNFEGARMTTYISSVVLTIGLSTLLQAWIGHRMAMVHGPNVIPSLAIVAAFTAGGEAYALQSFTAQAIAGVIIVALVLLGAVRFIRKVWSPLILGSMIIMIGLTVAQVGLGDVRYRTHGARLDRLPDRLLRREGLCRRDGLSTLEYREPVDRCAESVEGRA